MPHNVLYDTSGRGGVKRALLDSKRNVNGELCTRSQPVNIIDDDVRGLEIVESSGNLPSQSPIGLRQIFAQSPSIASSAQRIANHELLTPV